MIPQVLNFTMAYYFLRDYDSNSDGIKVDAHFLHDYFLDEARCRVKQTDVEKLTTVQIYIIISIVDIGSRKVLRAD